MCFFVDFNLEFQALQRYITEWLQICILIGHPLAYVPRGYAIPLTNESRGYPMPPATATESMLYFF
jgi:hypothetical protein